MWSNSLLHGSHIGSASVNVVRYKQSLFILFGLISVLLLVIFALNLVTAAKVSNAQFVVNHVAQPSVDIDSLSNQITTNVPSVTELQSSTDASGNVSSSSNVSSSTTVQVNGQEIPVPQNGSTQTTVSDNSGNHVNVSVQSDSSSAVNSHSFTSFHVNSNSMTQTNTMTYRSP